MQGVFENYQSGNHMVFKNKNAGGAILLGVISVLFLFNVSLCHAKNQPINAYEQVQARFGDSLNEGIKQLIGSEDNKHDINITPLSGGMTSANLFLIEINRNNYALRTQSTILI